MSIKNMTHGMYNSREYRSWSSMKRRCLNKKYYNYKNYGGRGITICDRWKNSFENFYADMGDRPIGMTLDRIDNDGNYCKENCRWATGKEQHNNKRTNVLLEYNNIKLTLPQWANILGINERTLNSRVRRGWDLKKAFNK